MRSLCAITGVLLVSGCASTPALQVPENFNDVIGAAWAMVDYCEGRGEYTANSNENFKERVGYLGDTMAIDLPRIRATKQELQQGLVEDPEQVPADTCATFSPRVNGVVAQMEEYQHLGHQANQERAAGQAASLAQIGETLNSSAAANTQPPMMLMPSNQPTFGTTEESDTRHIYKDGEITSCTQTSSGVEVCQ